MKLNNEEQDLIDFAYRINRRMGGNLSMLLNFGLVGIYGVSDYMMLLNHLKTNKNFGLITSFEHNNKKQIIWLDTLTEPLKDLLRADGKINWTKRKN